MKSMLFIHSLTIAFLNINLKVFPPVHLFALVGIAMGVDFITGVLKAAVLDQLRTSNGYRKTVVKFTQYGGSIVVALLLRYMASKQPEFEIGLRYITWIGDSLLVFIFLIECTSILENLYAIDQTSVFSRFLIKPLLAVLTLQIKNNPFNKSSETNVEKIS